MRRRPDLSGVVHRLQSRRARVLLVAALLALIPATAVAAELMSGDTVVVSSPVNDDLYLFGSDIRVDADVDGDIIAVGARVRVNGNVTGSVFATGADVFVHGNVGGSVMAAGANVIITGDVGHAIRAATSELTVEGSQVTGDIVAAAQTIRVDDSSIVGGDVRARAGDAHLSGDIGGSVRGSAGEWQIGGRVTGPIDIIAGTLRFVEGASITAPVTYTSDHEVLVDGGTTITASLSRTEPDHPTFAERMTTSLIWATFRYLWALALGLFLLRIAPIRLQEVSATLRARPLGSLGWGLLALLATPLVIIFLMITVVGLPVAIVVLAGYLLALYASQIIVGLVVGQAIAPSSWRAIDHPRTGRMLALGLLLVVLVRSLPIDGWYSIVALLTAIVALGALVIHLFGRRAANLGMPNA